MPTSSDKPGAEDREPKTNEAPERRPTEDEVRTYLESNPAFLLENPGILRRLVPPQRFDGDQVVDMQHFMVERLRAQLDMLSDNQHELIATTRSNMSSQAQIHRAVLALLQASDFEHLVHTATHDLSQILDIDVVTLCIEASEPAEELTGLGLYLLEPGTVEALLGEGRDILLRESTIESDTIFGPAAALVRSDALIRLHLEGFAEAGLLAMGSRDESRFHPGQGTELLSFLAQALERCILTWRNLP